MRIHVHGKHVDIGEALRERIEERIGQMAGKYFDHVVDAQVTVARDAGDFKVDCSIHLPTGMTLQAQWRGPEAYSAVDQAAERLEKRLRRYKRRLKDHHARRSEPVAAVEVASYVIAAEPEDGAQEPEGLNPVVIAEDTTRVPTLTVGEAVMQLDISDTPILLFRNSAHGGINVVYRRPDGNVGWIDPEGMKTTATA
ncbi:MAG: ribosome-associated translation inhibitor RaiA [Alphaproteobacteria bacterium]|nr:ribosome-associated translation inhibitor RaiA [Alphaproteobacteria bacterium]